MEDAFKIPWVHPLDVEVLRPGVYEVRCIWIGDVFIYNVRVEITA